MRKALALALVVAVGVISFFAGRISCLTELSRCHGQSGNSPSAAANESASPKTTAPADTPAKEDSSPVTIRSIEFRRNHYQRTHSITFDFTVMPDLAQIRRFIKIEPDPGELTVETESYCWDRRNPHNKVTFSGTGFKFNTEYQLKVSPEMAFDKGRRLVHEYTRVFKCKDLDADVAFVDSGRYLAPVGDRVLAIKSVNCTNAFCRTYAVARNNIVQLLARENGKYFSRWLESVDGHDTAELAHLPVKWTIPLEMKPNEYQSATLQLRDESGIISNGVYLVAIAAAKDPQSEPYDGGFKCRLVCLTDLGMSVRCDREMVRVWVTSLKTGKPVANVRLSVYAANGVELGVGTTAANGEAAIPFTSDREAPFAVIAESSGEVSFIALGGRSSVGEPLKDDSDLPYLRDGALDAFAWSERGIYRHGEKIMLHALVRNGKGEAPSPLPLVVNLLSPNGKVIDVRSVKTDERGAFTVDDFAVADDRPSGQWTLSVCLPGKGGDVIGERNFIVEDFVPPQVKVSFCKVPPEDASATNLEFSLKAEHMFGGPAANQSSSAVVSFSDEPFSPKAWSSYFFGDRQRRVLPNHTELEARNTGADGVANFECQYNDEEWKIPGAALKVTVQGLVLESGGRSSASRFSRVVHYHPYYLGVQLPERVTVSATPRRFKVAVVAPDGTLVKGARTLDVKLVRFDTACTLKERRGGYEWETTRIPRELPVAPQLAIGEEGTGELELSLPMTGDFELLLSENGGARTCRRAFWVAGEDDDEIRASLENPTSISIVPDKPLYREGEIPLLTVKAPFTGSAWLSVMREGTLYTRAFELTNATCTVELEPLCGDWSPNVDVALSVVQSVKAGANHLATRAHGITTLRIRRRDREIPVKVSATSRYEVGGGSKLQVQLDARGAFATGEVAVVTVVDEAINLLTAEPEPDPIEFFSRRRHGYHPLFDYFHELLPVYEGKLHRSGVKTGGGADCALMGRISPCASRRFKPLAQWQFEVPLTDGQATTEFKLPEFVGEVRVTAVAYTKSAAGASAEKVKVASALIAQPDAPRFVAPGDRCAITLALTNRSGKDGEVSYSVTTEGATEFTEPTQGVVQLADGECRVLSFTAKANAMGEGRFVFTAEGLGERHVRELLLPVRPAAASMTKVEVRPLKPGEQPSAPEGEVPDAVEGTVHRSLTFVKSPLAIASGALDYLLDYPYGCLEQTTSRILPLIGADKVISQLTDARESRPLEIRDIIREGIDRIGSMRRFYDFAMWPDLRYSASADIELSAYAFHCLAEAQNAGYEVGDGCPLAVLLDEFLGRNDNDSVRVYALHSLALIGKPNRDMMFHYYDERATLSRLDRSRLARAFVRTGDPVRARELLKDASLAPQSIKEAAFTVIALLETDPEDARIPQLLAYFEAQRDPITGHWLTTDANAHVLMALAACVNSGASTASPDGYVVTRTTYIPTLEARAAANNVLSISRHYTKLDGTPLDLENVPCGTLVIGELVLSADRRMTLSDLVIEDLLPACFEPDAVSPGAFNSEWVLRSDQRDDRLLVFSKKFTLEADEEVRFRYALRAVSAGDYIVPGPSVEAMYAPSVRACGGTGRVVVVR